MMTVYIQRQCRFYSVTLDFDQVILVNGRHKSTPLYFSQKLLHVKKKNQLKPLSFYLCHWDYFVGFSHYKQPPPVNDHFVSHQGWSLMRELAVLRNSPIKIIFEFFSFDLSLILSFYWRNYFTEVEQEAVMQENAMLQVNNVWLSLENICDSCSGSMVVVVNVSSLAVVNVFGS